MSYQYDYNELFDFNDTDNFLNNLSSSISSLSPSSLDGNELQPTNGKYLGGNMGYDVTNVNGKDEFANIKLENFDNFDSNVHQNLAVLNNYDYPNNNTMNNHGNNTQDLNSQASVSSHNDITPISQPSNQTTPEIKHEDDVVHNTAKLNPKKSGGKKKDKTSHNMIEKKYRTNINSKILMLRDAVPSLRIASGKSNMKIEELEGLTPASKLNKASVLTKATEYIQHLERKNELLRQQNLNLTRLIQQANLSSNQVQPLPPQSQPQSLPQQHQSQQQQIPNQGLSFPQQSLNTNEPMSQSSSSEYDYDAYNYPLQIQGDQPVQVQTQGPIQGQSQVPSQPNKYFLGGMAAVMGTSLFSGPDDFRGLSSIPFFPMSFAPIIGKFIYILKLLFIFTCICNILLPQIFVKGDKKRKGESNLTNWILVNFGLRLPSVMDEQYKKGLINRLLGNERSNFLKLINDYIYLSSLETNFENIFLNLLISSLIIKRYPIVNKLFSMSIKLRYSLILKLNDENELRNLSKLIDVDGVVLFKSNLISRLNNLMNGDSINFEIIDDSNYLKFVEIYQQSTNFYDLIFNWRVLEILNELNLVYITNELTVTSKLDKDITLIEGLLNETNVNKVNTEYFKMFKIIIEPKDVGELINIINSKITATLNKFKLEVNGLDLTDDEDISDTEEVDTESLEHQKDEQDEQEEQKEQDEEDEQNELELNNNELISNLNIITPEEFIIATSSIIINNQPESLKFLKYLEFEIPLSLLSFTSLLKLFTSLPNDLFGDISKDNNDDIKIDVLLKNLKNWINNNNLINNELTIKLNEMVVKKGMIMNGGEEPDE